MCDFVKINIKTCTIPSEPSAYSLSNHLATQPCRAPHFTSFGDRKLYFADKLKELLKLIMPTYGEKQMVISKYQELLLFKKLGPFLELLNIKTCK